MLYIIIVVNCATHQGISNSTLEYSVHDEKKERFIGNTFEDKTSPYIIAHRGYWNIDNGEENSIQSLRMAADLGVYGSEFDVHLTADDVPVVHHDLMFKNKLIQFTNYNEIKDMTIKNNEKLPTLEDYLKTGKDLDIKLILEIKPHKTKERDRQTAKIITDMVKYFDMVSKVEYITFSLEIGNELIRLSPESKVGYLIDTELSPDKLLNYNFSILLYAYNILDKHPEYIERARDLGLKTAVWTVNDINHIENFNNLGINFILTDIPLKVKEYFNQKKYQ